MLRVTSHSRGVSRAFGVFAHPNPPDSEVENDAMPEMQRFEQSRE